MYKPIEKEYIIVSPEKYAKISILSKHTNYSRIINSLKEEPFISKQQEDS
jgi:hypothetical protein